MRELLTKLITEEFPGYEEALQGATGPPHSNLPNNDLQSRYVEIKDIGPGPVQRETLARRNVYTFAHLVQLIKSIWWIRAANAEALRNTSSIGREKGYRFPYTCAKPPSPSNSIREAKLLESDARHTTAFAISSGLPMRPSGTRVAKSNGCPRR